VPASEERLIWSLSRFLAAAAKKYTPARIVVVIDGIFALKGEGMPAGALHWLPTELPPGVRFIVSTIARDLTAAAAAAAATAAGACPESSGSVSVSSSGGGGGAAVKPAKRRDHRTYMELRRRACPMLEMEPLSDTCQRAIIDAFAALPALPGDALVALTQQQQQQSADGDADTTAAVAAANSGGTDDTAATANGSISIVLGGGPHLSEAQIARILELQARNKPSYLRTLLYALRLGATLPATPAATTAIHAKPAAAAAADIDALLDVYLAAPDSLTLTSTVLDVCAQHVAIGEEGSKVTGAVLSVLYASRDGLTDEEVIRPTYCCCYCNTQCSAVDLCAKM
jgi:hypothetical protein